VNAEPGSRTPQRDRIVRDSRKIPDGTMQMAEVQAGSGYYSQSAAACWFGYPSANRPRVVRVRWPDGSATQHPVSAGETTVVVS